MNTATLTQAETVEAFGSPIRGNQGVDVYPRETGYFVEHFSLQTDPTTIVVAFGPFADKLEANALLAEYRRRWSNE